MHILRAASIVMLAASAWAQKPEDAMSLNESGRAATTHADYITAEAQYRRAIAIWRTLGPSYEKHLSIGYFNLAEALCGQGRWLDGKSVFEQSVALSRKALGPSSLRTLTATNALAHVYMMLGELDRAESTLNEILPIERELFPKDLQLAHTLAGLSSLHLRAGRADDALPLAEEALEIVLKSNGEDASETAVMYENVAQIHRAAGHAERALPLFRKARAIMERANSPHDPRYAAILSQEALALMDDGKLMLADRNLKEAMNLLASCPACSLELAGVEGNLGLLRIRQRKYVEAREFLTRALNLEETYAPLNEEQIGSTKRALDELRRALR